MAKKPGIMLTAAAAASLFLTACGDDGSDSSQEPGATPAVEEAPDAADQSVDNGDQPSPQTENGTAEVIPGSDFVAEGEPWATSEYSSGYSEDMVPGTTHLGTMTVDELLNLDIGDIPPGSNVLLEVQTEPDPDLACDEDVTVGLAAYASGDSDVESNDITYQAIDAGDLSSDSFQLTVGPILVAQEYGVNGTLLAEAEACPELAGGEVTVQARLTIVD